MEDKLIITDRCLAVVQAAEGKYELVPRADVLTADESRRNSILDNGGLGAGKYAGKPHFTVHGDGDFRNEAHFHRTVSNDLETAVSGGASSLQEICELLRLTKKPYFVNPVENN